MKVLTFGTFDHLHPGHRFVLDAAAARGDLHVVIARDASVRRIKGKTPVQPEEERAAAVHEAYPEATVLLGDPLDFLAPVRAVGPDIIVLGYDQCMPPGVEEEDLPCPVERVGALRPDIYKSSLRTPRA